MNLTNLAEKLIEAIKDNDSYPLAFVTSILEEIQEKAFKEGYNEALRQVIIFTEDKYKDD